MPMRVGGRRLVLVHDAEEVRSKKADIRDAEVGPVAAEVCVRKVSKSPCHMLQHTPSALVPFALAPAAAAELTATIITCWVAALLSVDR